MLSVNKILETASYHKKFIKYDPLIDFLRRIGKRNALKNAQLEATFKTYHGSREYEKLDFSSMLSIHTVILNKLCPNLKILTLNIRNGNDINKEPGPAPFWDDDFGDLSGKDDVEKIDEIVGMVMKGLPTLQKLKLGEYRIWNRLTFDEGTLNDDWGTSLRWEQYVKDRYAKRVKEKVKISGRAKIEQVPVVASSQLAITVEEETSAVDKHLVLVLNVSIERRI
jgi:hypothetical protein